MSLFSWGLLAQIVGSLFLSLHIFRSRQEEKDTASSWWNGNPFAGFNPLSKFVSFAGMVLIIFGFAVEFSLSLNDNLIDENLLFALAITLTALVVMYLSYILSGIFYQGKRYRHFAQFPLKEVINYLESSSSISFDQMIKNVGRYLKDLPNDFAKLFSEVLSSAESDRGAKVGRLRNYLEDLAK